MIHNKLILGEDQYYSIDCYNTKVNNNVLVVGAAGSGKTRGLVIPNILQATGSYIISDPKGQLYKDYAHYLQDKGYRIKVLDLIHPERSTKYNFFEYIKTERDVIKAAKQLSCTLSLGRTPDPFWDESTETLLATLIGYLVKYRPKSERTFNCIGKLIAACEIDEDYSGKKNALDRVMDEVKNRDPDSFVYKHYEKFRIGAGRTLKSILISLSVRLRCLDFKEIVDMMSTDEMNITEIGDRKTAVFVIVSDMERSMDCVANMFYSQALEELCRHADNDFSDSRLPYDVRFILDDFATNCVIEGFPKKISAFRSRGISTMLMLQSEQQLEACYPREGNIVIGNCDNYVYLGGNDLSTADSIARRCNVPTEEVLYMPIGTSWIIRRGQKPILAKNFDLDTYWKKVRRGKER